MIARVVQVHEFPPTYATQKRPFWRLDRPVVGDDGSLLRGGMFNHQRAWWEIKNFIKLLVGGYGAGKTVQLCKWGISRALLNAPYLVALVSPSYNVARNTTIATLYHLLSAKQRIHGSDAFQWDYNKTSHVFTIRYRSRTGKLVIYSGDNPLSLRGPNLASAGIDEPFIQSREVFDQIIARVRHPKARKLGVAMAGTPEELNWGYELAEGDLSEKHDVGIIHADTRENLVLAHTGYAERLLRGLDERAAKAYVMGQFIHLGKGLVAHRFDPHEHLVRLDRPDGSRLFAGMDFNVDPMTAAIYWRRGNHVHLFDEIELQNSDTEEMTAVLKERHPELRDVYPDPTGKRRQTNAPAGQTDLSILEAAGFDVHAPENPWPRRDRFNAFNGKLKPREGKITFTMDPKCKSARRSFSTYSYENMNKEDGKRLSHMFDAASYPIVYQFPIRKEWSRMVKVKGT